MIVHELNMWIHYLMGRNFELRTKHSGVKYVFKQQALNTRKTRWMEFLNEYKFDIKHIRWKENKVVDALSRRVHAMYATNISMWKFDLKRKFLEDVMSNEHYLYIKYVFT
jgi:hypothetical protein